MTALESTSQQQIRLEAPRLGQRLWRNNNGACVDINGRQIRYGLANDSAKLNKKIKSSDLIGITPIIITPDMVGKTLGVFTSVETKRAGWTFKGSEREVAQKAWNDLIKAMGGLSGFATCKEDLWRITSNI
jgi:ribosomal protein S19